MNDIICDIESEILIFADDTSLMAFGNDPNETAQQLNRDLMNHSMGKTMESNIQCKEI